MPHTTPDRGPSATGLAVILALGVVAVLVVQAYAAPAPTGEPTPGLWNPPHSRAEKLVAKMDGHAFAQLASDPTMARTVDDFGGDPENAAYRAARPLLGWVTFVASAGGRRPLLAPSMLVLTGIWVGALVVAVDRLARAMGARRVRGLALVALLPASIASMAYPGIADAAACALVLFALAAWQREERSVASLLFVAAALTRETTLLVAAGLGIAELWRTRSLRDLWGLFLAPTAYLAWTAVVHWRIGAWPSDYSQVDGALVGFAEGFPHWHPAEWATAIALAGSAAVIVAIGRPWMRAVLALHVAFFVFMNYQVWWVWLGFGRVGTVLPALAYVAWVTRRVDVAEANPTVETSAATITR